MFLDHRETVICIVFYLQKSGIHLILPGMVIDDYLFDPCGYSMNGVSKVSVSEHIFTYTVSSFFWFLTILFLLQISNSSRPDVMS